jgi:hypothetical protein
MGQTFRFTLPFEILTEILSLLSRLERPLAERSNGYLSQSTFASSLTKTALVCKAWLSPSRWALYQNPSIPVNDYAEDLDLPEMSKLCNFVLSIEQNRSLANIVNTLTFRFGGGSAETLEAAMHGDTVCGILKLCENVHKVVLIGMFTSLHLTHDEHTLSNVLTRRSHELFKCPRTPFS